MRRNVTGINRFVALALAIVWCCAGSAGIILAVVHRHALLALLSLCALFYAVSWFRVFVHSRLLTWRALVLPWRAG